MNHWPTKKTNVICEYGKKKRSTKKRSTFGKNEKINKKKIELEGEMPQKFIRISDQ